MLILAINGIYNLIISGDRTTLFIESVIASIFVLVPLALTIIPASEDYYVEFNNDRHGFNYFNGQPTSDSKIESSEEDDSDSNEDSKDSKRSIQTRLKTKSKNIRENHDGKFRLSRSKVEEENDGEDSKVLFDKNGSFLGPFKLGRSKDNDKNVLRNVDLSSSEFDSVEEREAKLNKKSSSNKASSSESSKSDEEDDLDYLIDSLNDDMDGGDYDDDFDFIEVDRPREISDEELARITDVDVVDLDENPRKEHKFKKSLNLEEGPEEPKPKRKSKTNTSKKVNKIKKEPKEEIEYEDFSDDFFDDGIFGDEGYESLLDDYVPPKPKSKKQNSKPKSSNKRNDGGEEDNYYDYEAKGADSVFNLDD